MADLRKLIVDGREVEVPAHYTLLQACEEAGAEIPRFCFHERLSIAGNCRMCLVELKGAPKPVASCAWGVRDCRPGPNGEPPEVLTRSKLTKKAREGVMEFLLINHPLDCPICDQGGECDLQDQAMAYGVDSSRFKENKRAVEDKYIGPLVKTIMTRCIHCTRCIRFSTEVAGVSELGATGRGEDMEITTYLERAMTSELQANVVDLCPVGALTSKPYAFKARPWELSKTESIDVMDALGSNIRVDARGKAVMRILPRLNEAVNEEWISDKTRYCVDGLGVQRLDQPYVRVNGRLQAASWQEAFAAIAERVAATTGAKIGALAGDLASVEEIYALKLLMQALGSQNIDCRQDGAALDPSLGRGSYIFNATVAGIEAADAVAHRRLQSAQGSAGPERAHPQALARWADLPVGVIGEDADLTYAYEHLGAGPDSLSRLVAGEGDFHETLKAAKRPLIIVGQGALDRATTAARSSPPRRSSPLDVGAVGEDWNGLSILHTAAARVGGSRSRLRAGRRRRRREAMIVAANGEARPALPARRRRERTCRTGAFVVYLGTHGDAGAHRADVILPGAAYTEKSGTYVNTEGRVQLGEPRRVPAGRRARGLVDPARAFRRASARRCPSTASRSFARISIEAHPHFAAIDEIKRRERADIERLAALGGAIAGPAFASPIRDFYLTNPIARASQVLAECSAMHLGPAAEAAE